MNTRAHSVLILLIVITLLLSPAVPALAGQSLGTDTDGDPPPSTELVRREATVTLEPFEMTLGATVPTDMADGTASDGVSQPLDGWEVIMSEDGEGNFPADNNWDVSDQIAANGDDYWDDVTCRSHTGGSSIWAAWNLDQTDCSSYDSNMQTLMRYGPFDLSGNVTGAKLDFYNWIDIDTDGDLFGWLASGDSIDYSGFLITGARDWNADTLDLSSYVGDSSVWIAFLFVSNSSANTHEGAYVDDIVLSKYVVDSLDPDIDVTPTSMTFTRNATASGAAVQASTVAETDYSQLSAAIEEQGQLPVIVRLKTDFVPEGGLDSPLAVGEQRYSIQYVQDQVLSDLSGQNVESVKRYDYTPHLAMTVDAAGLEALRQSLDVESIVEDMAVPPTLDLSIPLINADDVWAANYEGTGQVVAILDTGVDSSHNFLSGKVVSEACYSSNGATSTTVCPNGLESETGPGTGTNCDTSVSGCKHGTHVAGIAAGDGPSFDGVARGADIIAIQVFSEFSSGCGSPPCALSYTSDQMDGLERVYELRNSFSIAAVNMSLGGGSYSSACDSDSRKAMIDTLRSVGIATVIASGNDGYTSSIGAPACISTSVSVGATTSHVPADQVASYSNSAAMLDLLAPGSDINSSVPGGGFESWPGTSMATPHVAGAWAVLKSYKPDATVDEVLSALTSTGVPIEDTRNNLTKPRIDLEGALTSLNSDDILTIQNVGHSDLSVTGISVAEISAAAVECDWLLLNVPATPLTIAPGSTVQVGVNIDACEPVGSYSKNIQITSDDPDEGTLSVLANLVVAPPLAVTLSWFLAEPNGDTVNFQWQTTSETGSAGFNIVAKSADGAMGQLNNELIPSSVIDSVAPTRYSYAATTDATVFLLQEVGINGSAVMHGPFELSEPSGVYIPSGDDEVRPTIWLPILVR